MRIVALAGLLASLCMAPAAEAALVTYTFSGVGSGDLGGTAFTDRAFDLFLVGDSDLAADPFLTGQVFVVDPLDSARLRIAGLGEATLSGQTRLGLNRAVDVFFFGPAFGPDFLDLKVSHADAQAFAFTAPYGPVAGAGNTFGQFSHVATTLGDLTLASVSGVTFAAGPGPAGAAPEPAAWGLMILGFAGAGLMLRRGAAITA